MTWSNYIEVITQAEAPQGQLSSSSAQGEVQRKKPVLQEEFLFRKNYAFNEGLRTASPLGMKGESFVRRYGVSLLLLFTAPFVWSRWLFVMSANWGTD